ncbi:MAG TPA: class I tRNA ligase family protein, partial [Thermoplasmata archaeon]|nr:class I tRNA ligase family protein [Thermoplasmata archaeon]
RRVPMMVHHLIGREASRIHPTDTRIVLVPAMPPADDPVIEELSRSADALRAALVRATSVTHGPVAIRDRCEQEARRLRKFWELARSTVADMIAARLPFDPDSVLSRLGELGEEDRAFLSRFERLRNDVRLRYEANDLAGVHDRLARFMEEDLRDGYLPIVRPRLSAKAPTADREVACQVIAHVIVRWAELYAPIAPFTMEAVTQAFAPDARSIFERPITPTNEALLDLGREAEYDQWVGFAIALSAARRQVGLPGDAPLPKAVLLVSDDRLGERLLKSAPVLKRLGRVNDVEIDSPGHPWAGRRIESRPVPVEIQRVYGAKSARVVRLLELLPGRKALEGMRAGTLSVVLDGEPVRILPGMVEFVESLPECTVPIPWQDGEILLVDPTATTGKPIPALSLDSFAVARHLRRRIRRAGLPVPPERAVVAASGPLGAELATQANSVAEHVGVRRFEVVPNDDAFPLAERSTGRTRRGVRWSVWIPGLAVPAPREKHRTPNRGTIRVRRLPTEAVPNDLLSDEQMKRQEALDDITTQLAAELGRPIVGPSKAAVAWGAGFRSIEDLAHAPYDELVALPGFGPYVASEIVRHFGGTLPPRPPRVRPHVAPVPGLAPPPVGAMAHGGNGGPDGVPLGSAPLAEREAPAPAPPMAMSPTSVSPRTAPAMGAPPAISPSSSPNFG